MRILHLFNHSLPIQDGYALRSAAILREQARRGWVTCQVTGDRHPADALTECVDGLHFFRTRPSRRWLARQPVVEQLATVATLGRRVLAVARRFRPDVLHAHSPCLDGLAALMVGRELGLPVVYEMRSSWEDAAVTEGVTAENSMRYRLSRSLETFVLRQAAAVTTICEGLRADICARGGVARQRVTVVPNAVEAARFVVPDGAGAAVRERYAAKGEYLAGFIGSFYHWEGLDLLVEAAAHLRQRRSDFRILLIGGGVEEARLREQVVQRGLADTVIFTGRVPHADVVQYYSALDVLVYPRPSTPLTEKVTPLKPLEAMAAGRLVLASNIAGHRELVGDGETGLLFAAGDPEALAGRLGAVFDQRADTTAICARAARWVREERTWEGAVANYAPVYAGVLSPAHRGGAGS